MVGNLKVTNLIHDDAVLKAFHNYRRSWLKNPDYPYLTYMGINFTDDGIHSVKFYFHLFPWLNKETVSQFIPRTEDFFRYYDLHDQSMMNSPDTSGVAFTVKFYCDRNEPEYGFHYRMNPSEQAYSLAGGKTLLPFDPLPHTHSVGISHEYGAAGNEKVKRYLYFRGEEQKAFFAEHFGYPILTKTKFIEYAETKEDWKINTYYGKNPEAPIDANKLNSNQLTLLDDVGSKFGLNVKSYGYSQDRTVKSAYLFKQYNIPPKLGFLSMTQQYVDTIGHMLHVSGYNFGLFTEDIMVDFYS